jgi:hypothetical protein
MDLSGMYSSDWLIVDDVATVTLAVKGGASQSVPNALRREISTEDVVQDPALLEGTDAVFHLRAADLDGTVPKKGDKITDAAGEVFTIRSLRKQAQKTRYRCVCKLDRSA